MGIPVFSILILIFILWLHYEMRKNSRNLKNTTESFWQKEKNSNLTRRKDISQLEFLTVSLDLLPMEDHEDDTINSYRDTIRKYSERKMINLSGLTNTELKYKYGAANINILSEYDTNYTSFVSMLQKWAERFYSGGFISEAQTVLEYSVHSCLTDVTKAYRLLADIYHSQHTEEKIDVIIEIVQKTKIPDKEKLIEELVARKSTSVMI